MESIIESCKKRASQISKVCSHDPEAAISLEYGMLQLMIQHMATCCDGTTRRELAAIANQVAMLPFPRY